MYTLCSSYSMLFLQQVIYNAKIISKLMSRALIFGQNIIFPLCMHLTSKGESCLYMLEIFTVHIVHNSHNIEKNQGVNI